MPERIQLRRTKGWRKPSGTVVVSRPSPWGNPAIIERLPKRHGGGFRVLAGDIGPVLAVCRTMPQARTVAVEFFREWLDSDDGTVPRDSVCYTPQEPISFAYVPAFEALHYRLSELRGKDLACWCPLDQPCHADVLLEVANG